MCVAKLLSKRDSEEEGIVKFYNDLQLMGGEDEDCRYQYIWSRGIVEA